MNTRPVLVVGSINLDMVVSVRRIPGLGETITGDRFETFSGGKGANQAVGVARLGCPVSMIGRVGHDDFGRRLRRCLRRVGVTIRTVRLTPRIPTGVALISVDSSGGNTIIVIPGANGNLMPQDLESSTALIRSASVILVQLEIPLTTVEHLADIASRFDIPLVLDPAPAQKLRAQMLRKITWLTPNETEACMLCGAKPKRLKPGEATRYARMLRDRGVRNVVIKMGDRGAWLAAANGTSAWVPAFKVEVVDSVAAGDAFNAGLAVALAKEKQPLAAVRFASAVAALSVTRAGAQLSMPSAHRVRAFLSRLDQKVHSERVRLPPSHSLP